MGLKQLIAKVQPTVTVRIERHHVSMAMQRGLVKPIARVGMAFVYSEDSVEGLREYLRHLRPWTRTYRDF